MPFSGTFYHCVRECGSFPQFAFIERWSIYLDLIPVTTNDANYKGCYSRRQGVERKFCCISNVWADCAVGTGNGVRCGNKIIVQE